MRFASFVRAAPLALGLALWAGPAAASVELGLGADYWIEPADGAFQLTLAADTPLARALTVGGRFGVLFLSSAPAVGVPIDLRLRVHLQRLYMEGLVGPWFLFDRPDPVRAHVAFGFGILARGVTFGVEVGWLDPSTLVGIRLGFRI
jgi:hypothetical protein